MKHQIEFFPCHDSPKKKRKSNQNNILERNVFTVGSQYGRHRKQQKSDPYLDVSQIKHDVDSSRSKFVRRKTLTRGEMQTQN